MAKRKSSSHANTAVTLKLPAQVASAMKATAAMRQINYNEFCSIAIARAVLDADVVVLSPDFADFALEV